MDSLRCAGEYAATEYAPQLAAGRRHSILPCTIPLIAEATRDGNIMECLFIGGCLDGQWISIDHASREIRVPVPQKFNPRTNSVDATICIQSYRAEILREGDNEYTVYVHAVPPGRLIETLLNGYSANK